MREKSKRKATKTVHIFVLLLEFRNSQIHQNSTRYRQLQKHMKTPRWFSRPNSVRSSVRLAITGALFVSAGAMAFVATKTSSPFLLGKSGNTHQPIHKFRMDRDELFGNKRAMPGPERDRGPLLAAEEDYANRAYPATDIPFSATLNAQAAFKQVQARSDQMSNIGIWTLIGPSTANFPSILTFSGASYVTSGRITALAVDPSCNNTNWRVWAAAAGGGIWRTDNALSGSGANWTFISGSFATNAIGTLVYDAAHNTLYAGTGEPNTSVDSEAGLGIYKSIDGGNTWTHLASQIGPISTPTTLGTYTGPAFDSRAISGIAVDPSDNTGNTLYVASARGVRGVSSVSSGGVTANPTPPRPPFGLFKSTDGGANFTFIWDGHGTNRGVIDLALDPTNPSIVYASALNQGTWRSTDSGANFSLIKAKLSSNDPDRPSFAVTTLPNGKTRMYLGEGVAGNPVARFFRTDDATAANPVFTDLTTTQNINYCTGQCWYDNVVYTPPGTPDVVYLGGSFDYSNYGSRNNGRGFLYSTDAGGSFTDVTWDATTNPTPPGSCCQPNPVAPNGMHPDQHAIVGIPGTDAAIFGSDGGLMLSTGAFADISSQCTSRGLSGADLTLCQQLLSRVPTQLSSLNTGLSTLQFQSVSYNPLDPLHNLLGGTQDNGTWSYSGSTTWNQAIYGDGGQSGFNAANPALRFNTFTGQANDANFQNGDPSKWVIISAPIISSPEAAYFYPPVISDPNPINGGSIYQGSFSVWRTQDWGGNQAYLEANCPEFTTSASKPGCGDFVPIGPSGATNLTASASPTPDYRGTTRAGGAVAAIARAKSDTGTLWVATGTGRVFISKNADAAAGSVSYIRLDTLPSATADPGRFVTSIYIDPAKSNHAWISYSGYNFNTPSQPGHVFSVTYDPTANAGAGDATWTNLDGGTGPMGDLPVTALVRTTRGDLYAGTDFGVLRLASGSSSWTVAGTGLPAVEVAGLTLVNGSQVLYAATHGRSVWSLKIP
jgi:hypothetical protein